MTPPAPDKPAPDKPAPDKPAPSKLDLLGVLLNPKKVQIGQLLLFFVVISLVGAAAIVWLWSTADGGDAQILGGGLLLAGAAALTGGLGGLLFGIPHVNGEKDDADDDTPKEVRMRAREKKRLAYNNNLSDVSNWLTKAVVGASLVEIRSIWELGEEFFVAIGASFSTNAQVGAMIAGSIVLLYGFAGFFVGYFFASVSLPEVLERGPRESDQAG